jgi:hypothetical protein
MRDIADIRERLARIETKLDMLVALEPRVRKLEKWKNLQAGAAAIFGSVVTLFVRRHVGN